MSHHVPTPRCIDESTGAGLLHYALGTLSDEEKMRFEEHLIECAGCQLELDRHRASLVAMSSNRSELLDSLRGQTDSEWGRHRRKFVWSVAALAVAASIAAFLIRPKTPSTTFNTPVADTSLTIKETANVDKDSIKDSLGVSPPSLKSIAHFAMFTPMAYSPINVRAAESDARAFFRQGMELYQKRNFAKASVILQRACDADTTDTEIGIYAGVTLAIAGKFEIAQNILSQALRQNPRPARVAQLKWYLAQVAIAREDRKAAMGFLNELASGESAYRGDAQGLASKLANE